jgi:ABC-2 type transport system ATP-binding protein
VGPVFVIEVSDVSKRYGDVRAVNEVSLQVRRGEIYALLGLNGAGKTTLIRMLLGMIGPTAGSVRVLGTATAGPRGEHPGTGNGRSRAGDLASVWSRVGYLVEGPGAYPELTVRENLEVVRRLRRLPGSVEEVIDRLALTPYAARRARALSTGNLQRLALAKALIHHPDLLVLDEPVNGLDPAGVVEVRDLLVGLAREHGVTVFLSSHLLAEVAQVATRVGIIHHGRLLEELTTDGLDRRVRRRLLVSTRDDARARAVLEADGHRPGPDLALTGERAIARPDEIATLLVRSGCPPTRLVVEEETLESYFMRMVGGDA